LNIFSDGPIKKKTRSRKSNGLTIDIPKSDDDAKTSETNVDEDTFDVHEYVNLVDCQRYREEMSARRATLAGSNPYLHFPNVIGYASTQHILALYGNPRTPLLPGVNGVKLFFSVADEEAK
jgi:hypothetical protein